MPEPSTPRGAAAAAADGSNPLRISLFSLGNMCAHRECADALLELGICGSLTRLRSSQDATVQKYVQRIQVQLPCLNLLAPDESLFQLLYAV